MPGVAIDDHVTTEDFRHALANLVVASRQPLKQRSHQVPSLVRSICAYAYQNGLPTVALNTLLDTVTQPNHLDQNTISTLIKSLYPAGQVSTNAICAIISSLGQGKQKPSVATQNLLLKWIIMVNDVVEDTLVVSKLYGVLFSLLDMISIRATLCHLLAAITCRRHVKPFRIQMLLEVSRNTGNEPALLGLIRVYKDYYPDIILDQAASGRASRFSHPDPEWRDRVHIIQHINAHAQKETSLSAASFKVVRRGAKRIRVSLIPEVHTYRADESSTTLEEVDGVDDFVQKLDRIELPNQMISALDDPLLQKYTLLRSTDTSVNRINQWLALFFDEQLQTIMGNGGLGKRLVEVLEKVLSYTRHTMTLLESAQSFLRTFLLQWDGHENRKLILDLLAYIPLQSFEELQASLLCPLETAIIDNTTDSAITLLEYYTSLSQHWTAQVLSHPISSPSETGSSTSDFTAISALTAHASFLSLTILASTSPTQTNISSILSYHEALAYTISHAPSHTQIHVLTPLSQTIYLLTFQSPALSTLSRLCSILATYKRTFEAAMARPTHEYPRDYVNHFNGFLMDICNLLWRSRAFNTSDTNALGCLLPPSDLPHLRTYAEALTPPQSVPSLFSLSNGPILCALSIAAFRELEDGAGENEEGSVRMRHAGPIGQRSLAALAANGGITVGWAEYRLEVLKWLGQMGVDGIGQLMFCTMKHLMGSVKGTTA